MVGAVPGAGGQVRSVKGGAWSGGVYEKRAQRGPIGPVQAMLAAAALGFPTMYLLRTALGKLLEDPFSGTWGHVTSIQRTRKPKWEPEEEKNRDAVGAGLLLKSSSARYPGSQFFSERLEDLAKWWQFLRSTAAQGLQRFERGLNRFLPLLIPGAGDFRLPLAVAGLVGASSLGWTMARDHALKRQRDKLRNRLQALELKFQRQQEEMWGRRGVKSSHEKRASASLWAIPASLLTIPLSVYLGMLPFSLSKAMKSRKKMEMARTRLAYSRLRELLRPQPILLSQEDEPEHLKLDI